MPTYYDPWAVWTNQTTIVTNSGTQAWNCWVGTQPMPTASQTTVWGFWNQAGTGYYQPQHQQGFTPAALPERDRRIMETRRRVAELRRRVAQRTAERLLLEHLDDAQRREWEEGKYFHVETAAGRRRYRIALGLAGNVRLVRDGDAEVDRRYCMHVYHPDGPVPNEDNVLAQKLLIEANEDEFLRHANVA